MSGVFILSKFSSSIIAKLKLLLPKVQFTEVLLSDLSPLETAEIIIGDYDLVGPHLYTLPKLKWYQGTWAGLDSLWPHILKNQLPKFPITRTSGDNFGRIMGEYVVGNIVFWERNLFKMRENQNNKLWDQNVCEHDHRTFADLEIGILGIGSIGNLIGRTLNYLGATIYGYGRQETLQLENEEFKHITEYFTRANLHKLLSNVDYLINVLPKTEETVNLLGNDILKTCKDKNVVLINIGRGSVIKESELIHALKQKWISGAILDVFETEPLPKSSELWNFPNVFITPHVAGNSRSQDIAAKFKENYERFLKNEPLLHKVDFCKGY
ncbi:unnamed protein product [Ceutorhynchus assimilis]|uniref:D-isomer specific 2-hydroxyacid dehydrogenase NAD-binding domain-containing protein n=1 Tax=Ceutorhynchus assimilis TaxID=467358 RepID=A0A9N9MP18_9CUCU|nr:unnamed protein product [Ceutorhynchus assimilis]